MCCSDYINQSMLTGCWYSLACMVHSSWLDQVLPSAVCAWTVCVTHCFEVLTCQKFG